MLGEHLGRNRRPPTDPVNSMLSLLMGYAGTVTAATHIAGLDTLYGYACGDGF